MNKARGIALSGSQLERFLGAFNTTILRYEDLPSYNSIHEIFDSSDFRVLFIPSDRSEIGHWQVIINRNDKTFEFYDSFGYKPDEVNKILNDAPENQAKTHIKDLMPQGTRLVSVDVPFQNTKSNNCGRFVISRILAMKMPAKKYAELLIQIRDTVGDLDKFMVDTIALPAWFLCQRLLLN